MALYLLYGIVSITRRFKLNELLVCFFFPEKFNDIVPFVVKSQFRYKQGTSEYKLNKFVTENA